MKKYSGRYLSPFEHAVNSDFPYARKIDKALYRSDKTAQKPYNHVSGLHTSSININRLIGAFHPIVSTIKDFQYSNKPYRVVGNALMDIAQPVRGVGNVLRGIASLIIAPIYFLTRMVGFALNPGSFGQFINTMKVPFALSLSWSINGACSIVRGVAQMMTTPLTWIIRMPLRCVITGVKGTPYIKENEDIRRLINEGKQALKEDNHSDTIAYVTSRLHNKFKNYKLQGQKSTISSRDEGAAYQAIKPGSESPYVTANVSAYLNLFSTDPALVPPSPQKTAFVSFKD